MFKKTILICFILTALVGCKDFTDPKEAERNGLSMKGEISLLMRDRADFQDRLHKLENPDKPACTCDLTSVKCNCKTNPTPKPVVSDRWYRDTTNVEVYYYGHLKDGVLYYSHVYYNKEKTASTFEPFGDK